jgi:hypothetical protein
MRLDNRALESRFAMALVHPVVEPHAIEADMLSAISRIAIVVFLFEDIYVGKNATLVCDAKTHVLFARYITLDHGASLVMRAPASRIDCAGIVARNRFDETTTFVKKAVFERSVSNG